MSNRATEPIDQLWIREQVDALAAVAKEMPEGIMREAVLFRAHTWLDLVQAWRERK